MLVASAKIGQEFDGSIEIDWEDSPEVCGPNLTTSRLQKL